MMLKNRSNSNGIGEPGLSEESLPTQSFNESFPEMAGELRKYQAAKTKLMDRLKTIVTVAAITCAVILGSWGVWKVWPDPDPMAAVRAEAAAVAQLTDEVHTAYQLAQAEIATTRYQWTTDQNSYYKIQQTVVTNGDIAKYNTLRNKLPEAQRQSFPELEYLSGK